MARKTFTEEPWKKGYIKKMIWKAALFSCFALPSFFFLFTQFVEVFFKSSTLIENFLKWKNAIRYNEI